MKYNKKNKERGFQDVLGLGIKNEVHATRLFIYNSLYNNGVLSLFYTITADTKRQKSASAFSVMLSNDSADISLFALFFLER